MNSTLLIDLNLKSTNLPCYLIYRSYISTNLQIYRPTNLQAWNWLTPQPDGQQGAGSFREARMQQNRNQGFSKPGFSQEPELWLWVHQTQKLFRRITFIIISKKWWICLSSGHEICTRIGSLGGRGKSSDDKTISRIITKIEVANHAEKVGSRTRRQRRRRRTTWIRIETGSQTQN